MVPVRSHLFLWFCLCFCLWWFLCSAPSSSLCFHQFLSLSVSLDVSFSVSPLIWPSASRYGCQPGLITWKPSQRATLIAVPHGVPLSWSTDISVSPNFCLPYPPSGLSLNVTLNFEGPKLHEKRDFLVFPPLLYPLQLLTGFV